MLTLLGGSCDGQAEGNISLRLSVNKLSKLIERLPNLRQVG